MRIILTAMCLAIVGQPSLADRVMHKGLDGSFTCKQVAYKAVFSDNSVGDVVFDSAGIDVEISNNILTLSYRGTEMESYSYNLGYSDDFMVEQHHFDFVAMEPKDHGISNMTLLSDRSSNRIHLVETETRVGSGRIFVRNHIWMCKPKG